MRPHFDTMKEIYEKITDAHTKELSADVVSVLAMTMSDGRDCLKYRLLGTKNEIANWGHEYVRYVIKLYIYLLFHFLQTLFPFLFLNFFLCYSFKN